MASAIQPIKLIKKEWKEDMPAQQPISFSDNDAVRGMDVSHRQGDIDWGQVAASGIQFCYVKATEGVGFKDIRFREYFDSSKTAGLLTGAYHFFRPDKDAEAQAESFIHVVSGLKPGDLPPVLDVEVSAGKDVKTILDGIQQWLEAVENVLGHRPIVYTYPSFWNQTLSGSSRFADHMLWVANYTANTSPKLPIGFSDYVIWQFSEHGKITGISGDVDLDRFHGTLDDLKALAWL